MSELLKQELIKTISETTNEELLQLLKADIDYLDGNNYNDPMDELSTEDQEDLSRAIKEPFGTNTVTQKDFDDAINRWRTK
jgi:hypothetical protein